MSSKKSVAKIKVTESSSKVKEEEREGEVKKRVKEEEGSKVKGEEGEIAVKKKVREEGSESEVKKRVKEQEGSKVKGEEGETGVKKRVKEEEGEIAVKKRVREEGSESEGVKKRVKEQEKEGEGVKKQEGSKVKGEEGETGVKKVIINTSGRITRAKKQREEMKQKMDAEEPESEDAKVRNDKQQEEEEELVVEEGDRGSDTDDADETCFRIDKVYSVADEQIDLSAESSPEEGKKKMMDENSENNESMKVLEGKKEEGKKEIHPIIHTTPLTKVQALGRGVRMLGAGVRGTNMPFIVSMGAGGAGIPLLPAGLPPGRYVILPGTSTPAIKTPTITTSTPTTQTPRLVTSGGGVGGGGILTAPNIHHPSTNTVPPQTPSTPNTPTAQKPHPHQPPAKLYTRERGRRKSYTTGEKLAMIEAVEGGQRKSVVADRFGVAPSTLACILAQRHKIRSEKDNLARRRMRPPRSVPREEQHPQPSRIPSRRILPSPDQPFTHFLAPLSSPQTQFFDTQPEEIIAVPDLVERISNAGGGGSSDKNPADERSGGDNDGDNDDDGDEEGVTVMQQEPTIDSDMLNTAPLSPSPPRKTRTKKYHHTKENDDVGEEIQQDSQGRTPSPQHGLTGPYLLKKESHCTTVLDQLMRDDTYTDVTLTAEGHSLRAHRIVLCLASSYFRQVLSRDMSTQSVVILRDIKFAELRNIIHFIYTGEATVDATELESFIKTAEMLEISSLCEGQKCLTSRGLTPLNTLNSSFSISDFERLVGTKRTRNNASPTPSKARRVSGEGRTSNNSSTVEPSTSTGSITIVKEEPDFHDPQTLPPDLNDTLESDIGESDQPEKQNKEEKERKRARQNSASSIGVFASIAGVQGGGEVEEEGGEEEEGGDVFSPPSPPPTSTTPTPPDITAVPGRCPYCPHINQKFEGVSLMRHLSLSHPSKPAFPCDKCWCVFVKRSCFKTHQNTCQASVS